MLLARAPRLVAEEHLEGVGDEKPRKRAMCVAVAAAAGRLDEGSPTPEREYRDPINHEAVVAPSPPTPPLRALRGWHRCLFGPGEDRG